MATADNLPVLVKTLTFNAPKMMIYSPLIGGMKNENAQRLINHTILLHVQALIKKQNYYENPTQTEISGSYDLKNNQREVLSLTLNNFAYTQHAAHGMTYLKGLSFDTKTGKEYMLKDLFLPGGPYVQVLSALIEMQIKKRDITLLNGFPGIKPNQDFYIADKCLVIFFQLYEITAYVYGFPMFPISVYEISNIIDENGPLGKMLPSD